jgi:glycosyltransferase involved in cell wall biosynthesis
MQKHFRFTKGFGKFYKARLSSLDFRHRVYHLKGRETPGKVDKVVKMRVCMLSYSFYEMDNRVRRYAETLLMQGHDVDVISIRKPSQPSFDTNGGLRVFRIQKRSFNEKNKLTYLVKLLLFSFKSFVVLSLLHLRRPYHLVHVHNVPDFLVFSAFLPKLTGAKIILDIHDILPEFYLSKFSAGKRSLAYKGLVLIEKLSAMWSDHVIASNHIWHSRYISRSAESQKCTVIMNYPDSKLFCPLKNGHQSSLFTFVYPGTLSWHQGLDIAVEAFALLSKKSERCRFDIYGHGPTKDDLMNLIAKLGLEEIVHIHDTVPREQIAEIMARADCGIVAKRSHGFADEAFSTKIWEFMAVGTPVIVPGTTIDRYYFDDSRVLFFEPEDVQDLAEKMEKIVVDSDLRKRLAERGLIFSYNNSWDEKKTLYNSLIDSLLRSEQEPYARVHKN